MWTSVTLARCSGIFQSRRISACGNDGIRDSSSVSRCDRSIQGPAAPEIFGAGTSSQPFQPGILSLTVSHISHLRISDPAYFRASAEDCLNDLLCQPIPSCLNDNTDQKSEYQNDDANQVAPGRMHRVTMFTGEKR